MTIFEQFPEVSRDRLLQWWALLNCHERPGELSHCGEEELADLFRRLEHTLPERDRRALWNGSFNYGKNRKRFITL